MLWLPIDLGSSPYWFGLFEISSFILTWILFGLCVFCFSSQKFYVYFRSQWFSYFLSLLVLQGKKLISLPIGLASFRCGLVVRSRGEASLHARLIELRKLMTRCFELRWWGLPTLQLQWQGPPSLTPQLQWWWTEILIAVRTSVIDATASSIMSLKFELQWRRTPSLTS